MMKNNIKLIEDESMLSQVVGGFATTPKSGGVIKAGILTVLHDVEKIVESLAKLLTGSGQKSIASGKDK